MSVLLEALKKAAEDKKKTLESSEQSKKVEVSSVQKGGVEKDTTPEPSIVREVLDHSAEIKLSLNEGATLAPAEESIQKSKTKNTPSIPPISKENPEATLKLDLSLDDSQNVEKKVDSVDPVEKEPEAIHQASLKLVIDEIVEQDKPLSEEVGILKTTQNRTKSNLELDEVVRLKMDLHDEPLLEKTIEPCKESVVEASDLLKNEVLDLHLEKKALTEEEASSVLDKASEDALKKDSFDKSQPPIENKQTSKSDIKPSKIDFDMEDKKSETVSEKKKTSEYIDSLEKTSMVHKTKKSLKEDEDSYKWSLDALPGYLGLGKKKKHKKNSMPEENPILVSGALSEDPRRPKNKSSMKLVLILLVLLLFIGILLYGTLYYQAQYDTLEQRMKKYNLIKTHIAAEELSEVSNRALSRSNKSEITSKEESLREIPLNESKGEDNGLEEAQKVPMVIPESIESSENNTQIIDRSQNPNSAKKPMTELVTQKRETVVRVPDKKSDNNRAVNVSKISAQTLDKTSNKAVIKVHSEESILSEAYLSYEQGEFFRAEQAFESVLAMNPSNEFALIGLGNILASKQQYVGAMGYYQKALSAQPTSLNAFEAIANISGHIELTSDWKTALSEMAQDHSESATLQYALGNAYAAENDWLAAQAAYFQAVALEPDNADYLVNLAVSLDQLGKYNLAARYYTEALAFVDVERVNFNEAQVKNRLISIRQFMAGSEQ